jgi:hypothetical protein
MQNFLNRIDFDASDYLSSILYSFSIEENFEETLFDSLNKITFEIAQVADTIEDEVARLQNYASLEEDILLEHLESYNEKLTVVGQSVDEVKQSFDKASIGAIRIGSKLSTSEIERVRIEYAIELLEFIDFFEAESEVSYEKLECMDALQLRDMLPYKLKNEDWGVISKVFDFYSWLILFVVFIRCLLLLFVIKTLITKTIIKVLNDLKKIVYEINSNDVTTAQVLLSFYILKYISNIYHI